MSDTGTRRQDGRPRRAGGPAFDLLVSKLRRPLVRAGTVRRSRLLERLARADQHPVVSVVAPARYGTSGLSTHLSFPEIATEMFVSRYTVKSQAFSIYRKLGVSSRSQAVARSRDLGLLER